MSKENLNAANPCFEWLSNQTWKEICALESVNNAFRGLKRTFETHANDWREFINSEVLYIFFLYDLMLNILFKLKDPNNLNIPAGFNTKLNKFQRILLMKTLRIDKVIQFEKIL